MTTTNCFVVVLADNESAENIAPIMTALRQVKGVLAVEPQTRHDFNEVVAKTRTKVRVTKLLEDVIKAL